MWVERRRVSEWARDWKRLSLFEYLWQHVEKPGDEKLFVKVCFGDTLVASLSMYESETIERATSFSIHDTTLSLIHPHSLLCLSWFLRASLDSFRWISLWNLSRERTVHKIFIVKGKEKEKPEESFEQTKVKSQMRKEQEEEFQVVGIHHMSSLSLTPSLHLLPLYLY